MLPEGLDSEIKYIVGLLEEIRISRSTGRKERLYENI